MLGRLVSLILATAMLLLSSGTTLLLHERFAHADDASAGAAMNQTSATPADPASVADVVSALGGNLSKTLPLGHDPRHRADCPVCQAILHLLLTLVAIAGLLLAFLTTPSRHRPVSTRLPLASFHLTPRSSRGPPLLLCA